MVRLRYVAEDIPINKIAAGIESIEQTVYAIEGAKVKIFIIVIFNICTSIPTGVTMSNIKEFS